MRLGGLGRSLLAIATASLGLWSLWYGEFAWGSQPALSALPWPQVWVYGSALIILCASVGLCLPRTALPSVLTIGAYQGIWAAIAIPQILSKPLGIGAWYPFFEALTALTGSWVLYASLRRHQAAPALPGTGPGAMRMAQALFGLSCAFYGWSHFVYAGYTASMVPGWLPGRLTLAYLTGLGHLAAGIALICGILPRLAATLEAAMMSLFGILVWAPSFFLEPRPAWATPPEHQWSESILTLVLAVSAWLMALSIESHRTPSQRGERPGADA